MKKSIFKRIGLIALAVCVAIGSFFVPLNRKTNDYASADNSVTSHSFNGSNILTVIPGYQHNLSNAIPKSEPFYLNFDVNFYTQGNQLFYDFSETMVSVLDNGSIGGSSTIYTNSSLTSQTSSIPISTSSNNIYLYTGSSRFNIDVKFSNTGFISDIYKIELGSKRVNYSGSGIGNTYYYDFNFIRYYDTNDYYVEFSFLIFGDASSAGFQYLRFNNRTYFITNIFSDSQIYQQGYTQGLADNQQNIYDNGYNAGYDVGYGNGVTDGRADANDYSFVSLIGAVVDVPVQTFLGLFEFEILGVNLASFFLSLLTFAVIIFVIKLVIGGK